MTGCQDSPDVACGRCSAPLSTRQFEQRGGRWGTLDGKPVCWRCWRAWVLGPEGQEQELQEARDALAAELRAEIGERVKPHQQGKTLTLRYHDLARELEHRGRYGEALEVLAEGREALAQALYKPGPDWLRTEARIQERIAGTFQPQECSVVKVSSPAAPEEAAKALAERIGQEKAPPSEESEAETSTG